MNASCLSANIEYDIFADREDCFLAACEHALSEATAITREPYESQSSWRNGVRAALTRLLTFFDEEPRLANLLIVETLAAGETVRRRREEVLDVLAEVIDRGRMAGNLAYPPSLTGAAIIGGVLAVIRSHLLRERREPLLDLGGRLMSLIVAPYLGARAARQELDRPAQRASRPRREQLAPSTPDPLGGIRMRLTYRTVRVLMSIAEHPGASNRAIAEGAGVEDQGQISKLLTRLARLGLAENVGGGQEKGTANAWRLTANGMQLERAARPLR